MKQIKLVMLVCALILSAAGGFASYQMRQQTYYIQPGTSEYEPAYMVASSAPSIACGGPGANYLCTVAAANGYSPGQSIPAYDCIIISSYNW